MAGKRQVQDPPRTPPTVTPDVALNLIRTRIVKAHEVLEQPSLTNNDHAIWKNTTRDVLVRAFGSDSPNVAAVIERPHLGGYPMNAGDEWWSNKRKEILRNQVGLLGSCIEQLETDIAVSHSNSIPHQKSELGASTTAFLVHGRDDGKKSEVARLLQRLGIEVVILHEQANTGRTLIEKFEAHASTAQFAVVLLTADDVGGLAGASPSELQSRARQNVILELGYFFGKLGRGRVCALYEKEVELPSDIHGIAFVQLDDGGAWQFQLARELKNVGFQFDSNVLL